jgi:hypothetical protein
VPTWLQKFASGDNPWRSPDERDRENLRILCEVVLGDDFKIDISEQSAAWKKVRFTISIIILLIFLPV